MALHYNGDSHALEAGDSAYLDGGSPHGWENLGTQVGQGALGDPRVRGDEAWPTAARVMVDFRTEPSRYRHWKLSVDGRVATLAMDVQEDGGLVPGYELKLNSYDLGVDIELYDAIQRLRFEHPEVGRGHPDLRQGADLLRGRQHPHAQPVLARLEGELLQVHQRDAQRDRGSHRGVAPGLALRGERALRGRRLRAGARHRLHRHGRRRLHHGGAAGGAAPRRAARAPAGSRGSSTSGGCGAIAPTSSARSRRASRASARSSGGWWTRWCRARGSSETTQAARRRAAPRAPIVPAARAASR